MHRCFEKSLLVDGSTINCPCAFALKLLRFLIAAVPSLIDVCRWIRMQSAMYSVLSALRGLPVRRAESLFVFAGLRLGVSAQCAGRYNGQLTME